MDILFIVPAFQPLLKEESIGTLILAKEVEMAGYEVGILRYWQCNSFSINDYNSFLHNFVRQILEKKPTIVSFYCRCTEYHVCIDLAHAIKANTKSTTIVFGGPQAELVAKETMHFFEFIDYIACSEGENTIVPLMKMIIDKTLRPQDIPGLCYRNESREVCQNEFPKFMSSDYVRGYDYYDLIPSKVVANSKSITLDVGRGCPFSCTFCSTKTFWKQRYRLRNIEDMISEIKWVISNYAIRRFTFDHDLFTVNKSKMREFCNAIKRDNIDIRWSCASRLDTITPELIDIMEDAGMKSILFGVESGSKRMQKIINKNLNLSKGRDIIKHCVSKGVKAKASFIYGFPEETEEDFEDTLRLAVDFQNIGAHIIFWKCGILNGTAMFEKFHSRLYLSKSNWKNYSFFGFKENYKLVEKYPEIFPQFYDFPNPLTTKLSYFEIFFAIWEDLARDRFNGMANEFLSNGRTLLDMYQLFVDSNKNILKGHLPNSYDKFWGFSVEQCNEMVHNMFKCFDSSKLIL